MACSAAEPEDLVSIKSLGLARVDTAQDAEPIVNLIKQAKRMRILSLIGTSVGVDAAEAIGQALSEHTELQEAWWADMFVSRLKTEIPDALRSLGNGLITGHCRLTVLDLSDNAVGPVGFKGLGPWLTSSVCYGLEELKLNNTGMGPHGACLLADALEQLVDSTKSLGGFKLKSFVCGRSRLENEGASRLAKVFAKMGHLEKIVIPQDGIGHEGISAICDALKNNPKMKHIDFSDNTLTRPGGEAVAMLLPEMKELEVLILGDCLLSDDGAGALASSLEHSHLPNLRHLSIQYNELCLESVIGIVEALEGKTALGSLEISGNPIGRQGLDQVEGMLDALGKANVLGEVVEIDEEYGDEEEEEEDEGEDEEDVENGGGENNGETLPPLESSGRFDDKSNMKNGDSLVVRGVGISPRKEAGANQTGKPAAPNPLIPLFNEVVTTTEARSSSPKSQGAMNLFKKVPTIERLERQWVEDLALRFPCTLELTMHLLVQLASATDGNHSDGIKIESVIIFSDMLLGELKAFYTTSPTSPLASFDNGLGSAFLSAFGLVKGEALHNAKRTLPTKGAVWQLVGHLSNQSYFTGAARVVRSFLDATASSGWGVPFQAGSHQDLVRRHLLGSLSSSSS